MSELSYGEHVNALCDLARAPPRMRADFIREGTPIADVMQQLLAFSRQVASLPPETAARFRRWHDRFKAEDATVHTLERKSA